MVPERPARMGPILMRNRDTSLGGAGVNFAETVWGMVERARAATPEARQAGLEELARAYWKPVYHYLRVAWAKSNEDAKDLAQAFFLWLTDRNALERYAPERGSFRTFLKALLRHFVQHHDEALDRLKRGGGRVLVALDTGEASLGSVLPDPKAQSPDEAFEREWKNALMAAAVERVRRRLSSGGAGVKFRVFEAYYLDVAPEERPTYAAVAGRLGVKEGEIKHYLCDVREEVRNEIREQLAQTLSKPEDFQEEWNAFFSA
jgi:RNA polymerase sigma-70 factor (ECF subfamily)